jgi:hypothetical protein
MVEPIYDHGKNYSQMVGLKIENWEVKQLPA